jgi:BirA family biotin operon repressor/biotin-[acetyl-CoA-carboxylase] ligase
MVVGIGLNVNQTLFISNAPNPISLKMITKQEYNLDEMLQKLLRSVYERYLAAKTITKGKIETDYQKSLYRILEWHNYLIKGINQRLRITGTTVYGQLVLENEAGETIVCDLKEVRFII